MSKAWSHYSFMEEKNVVLEKTKKSSGVTLKMQMYFRKTEWGMLCHKHPPLLQRFLESFFWYLKIVIVLEWLCLQVVT